MRMILGSAFVAALAVGGAAVPAHADSTVNCPLVQATRTIVNLPSGWSADTETSSLTDHRVEGPPNQQMLICEYGEAGSVQRAAPNGEACRRLPGRRFRCNAIVTGPDVIAQGQIILTDNSTGDFDGSGDADVRLRPGGPLNRLLDPRNGARLSPQGSSRPNFDACVAAPYSGNSISLVTLPVGSWLCVATSEGNFARAQIASIQGVPALPLPITVVINYTTWSGSANQPPPVVSIYSTGLLSIPQGQEFDLDEGEIGSGTDFWFQPAGGSQLYINPRNGAQLAVGNRTNRGYDGCSGENYSSSRVSLNALPVGSYVCAVTADGHIAQFRVNGIIGGSQRTLRIGYTTWE